MAPNHPNRGNGSQSRNPTADEIRTLRESAGLTQAATATLLHTTLSGYQRWEQAERAMHPGLWELMRIRIGDYLKNTKWSEAVCTYWYTHKQGGEGGRFEYGIAEKTGYPAPLGSTASVDEARQIAEALAVEIGLDARPFKHMREMVRTIYGPQVEAAAAAHVERLEREKLEESCVLYGGDFPANISRPGIPMDPTLCVAAGRLASWWVNGGNTADPGVFAASSAVAAQDRPRFVVVKYEGQLAAVTVSEAFENGLRETTDGVEWHRMHGFSEIANRAANAVLRAAYDDIIADAK